MPRTPAPGTTWPGYQATGKLDDAFKTCASRGRALDYLRAWNLLETVANAQSKLDEVVELCRQTVAKEPHNCAAHMTLARILKKQGHLAEADQAFKSAYEVAADEFNDPDSFESLGNDLVQTGEFAAAADVLQIVVRMTPKKLSALRSLGRAFSAQKKDDAAAKVLNDAVVLPPRDGAFQAALGYAWSGRPLRRRPARHAKRSERCPNTTGCGSSCAGCWRLVSHRCRRSAQTLPTGPWRRYPLIATGTNLKRKRRWGRAILRLLQACYALGLGFVKLAFAEIGSRSLPCKRRRFFVVLTEEIPMYHLRWPALPVFSCLPGLLASDKIIAASRSRW